MSECELCGVIEDNVFKCKRCGTRFCEECGSPTGKLCIECIEAENEDYQEDIYFNPPSKSLRPWYSFE